MSEPKSLAELMLEKQKEQTKEARRKPKAPRRPTQPKINQNQIFKRLDKMESMISESEKKILGGVLEILSKMSLGEVKTTSFALNKSNILRMIYKKQDVLPSDFALIYGKENSFEIRELLMKLWKEKYLVKNGHGHYTINPELNIAAFIISCGEVDKKEYISVLNQIKNKVEARDFKVFT